MFNPPTTHSFRSWYSFSTAVISRKFIMFFFVLFDLIQAQAECQNAAVTYEKACQLHKGARDTIKVAEEKLMNNPGMFDAAWQEMLNNANLRVSTCYVSNRT